jgi:diguanylate cyclase (GGDEF)-like protein
VRGGDVVARLGGDEFIVLVDHLNDPTAVMLLVGRIERALTDPFPVPSGTVLIGVSVGVAMADASSTVEQLISDADRAMYERKRERSIAVVSAP